MVVFMVLFPGTTKNIINHQTGCGSCLKDSSWNKYESEFKDKFKKEKYSIIWESKESDTYFTKSNSMVTIVCQIHGSNTRTGYNMLNSNGCLSCNSNKSSNMEVEFLKSLNIPNLSFQAKLTMNDGSDIHVDGYDKKNNTVYEFHRDYWHGNPRIYNPEDICQNTKLSYGKMYAATLLRSKK